MALDRSPAREGRYSSPRVTGSGVVPAHPRPRASMNVRVSRKDSREYLRLHQLEPYFEDVARQALEKGDRPAERMRTSRRRAPKSRARPRRSTGLGTSGACSR